MTPARDARRSRPALIAVLVATRRFLFFLLAPSWVLYLAELTLAERGRRTEEREGTLADGARSIR
jgi:hypothetical protein